MRSMRPGFQTSLVLPCGNRSEKRPEILRFAQNDIYESDEACSYISTLPRPRKTEVMKYYIAVCLMLSLLSAAADSPKSVEIRFCPASAVRTYPLESRRDLHSLLLQNAAIINHGHTPLDVKEIHLELLKAGQVLDTKKLDAKVIQSSADRGAKAQAAGGL